MSSYLFVMSEGGGNVPPELAIARRLVTRGHGVRVIADPTLKNGALAAGCGFVAWRDAPHALSLRPEHALVRDWELRSPLKTFAAARDNVICGPALRYANEVLAELAAHPAEVVACDMMLPGGLIAAEKAGLPSALLIPNIYPFPAPGRPILGSGMMPDASALGRVRDAVLARVVHAVFNTGRGALNDARRALGLPAIAGTVAQYERADVMLVLSTPAFDFPGSRFPANVRYVGPQLDDPHWAGGWRSPWPAEDARPLVLVSLSSTYQAQTSTLQNIISALGALDIRALVTKGPALSTQQFSAADHVRVVESAPHSAVLREAALTVSHCGHGTTLKALAAGVPLLCLPMGRDQADNAARVVYHGAGKRMKANATVDEIRDAVKHMLDDGRYRAAAERLARTMLADTVDDRAVRELERLAPGLQTEQTITAERGRTLAN